MWRLNETDSEINQHVPSQFSHNNIHLNTSHTGRNIPHQHGSPMEKKCWERHKCVIDSFYSELNWKEQDCVSTAIENKNGLLQHMWGTFTQRTLKTFTLGVWVTGVWLGTDKDKLRAKSEKGSLKHLCFSVLRDKLTQHSEYNSITNWHYNWSPLDAHDGYASTTTGS